MINEPKKTIIFVSPETQYENLGDLIIIKVLLKNLRNYGKLVINDRNLPQWFCQELEIQESERASKHGKKFISVMLNYAIKNLLQWQQNNIYYVLTPGHRFSKSISNVLEYFIYLVQKIKDLIILALLKTFNFRICRFGVSIGPFSKIDEFAEKLQSEFMYFYSVRDTKSENYAQKIGINKVKIFPDLAWLLKIPNTSSSLIKSNDEYVIFSFRESTHPLDKSNTYRNHLFSVLDEIVDIVCIQWQKKLLISYQVDLDFEFCQEISDRYKEKYPVIFINERINSQKMYDLYSQAYMIFSNRLHVLMFGTICGSIPVAVVDKAKHDKIIGIYSDAGLMPQVIDISSSENILDRLSKMAANTDLIKQELALCIQRYQNSGNEIFQDVMTDDSQSTSLRTIENVVNS
ncbi:polysaccharide pyruvyl transferase family protein [Nostoc sp. FACHB-110]|uniref:polysaccharide pyruvyl transferase family protein n=1 Tax=Nostoc sp. FACHB-110 TaxID=2692834 RepID=UPI00168972AF|nr:polysaccharide pyruvyl transferase family protein [Nostoc sp. FACHB-110]MBD2436526.1 polysaccharide pyruvyl transferase family protein [Nostoc sp. FACHB-110]